MHKTAKFNIGDVVIHKKQGYRAIIVDVDPLFQASGRYNPQAIKREFSQRNPWYRLLVDGSAQMTYVEECQLIRDISDETIDNPHVEYYLTKRAGNYFTNNNQH
jgi:heat shock protein HspQ